MTSGSTTLLLTLFETVPHVMICVKDREGRYVAVNDAFVRRTRQRSVADVVGRRAIDLFPAELAASFDAQDRSVFHTGRPSRNQLEIITDATGQPGWFLSTKVLGTADDGADVIVAVSVEAQLPRGRSASGGGLSAALELARRDLGRRISVGDMAHAAGLSPGQLGRVMRRVLAVSPKQYLLQVRAEHAATLLATTDRSLSAIASQCGYYDQSQLTRQFKALYGLTPGAYRTLATR